MVFSSSLRVEFSNHLSTDESHAGLGAYGRRNRRINCGAANVRAREREQRNGANSIEYGRESDRVQFRVNIAIVNGN